MDIYKNFVRFPYVDDKMPDLVTCDGCGCAVIKKDARAGVPVSREKQGLYGRSILDRMFTKLIEMDAGVNPDRFELYTPMYCKRCWEESKKEKPKAKKTK